MTGSFNKRVQSDTEDVAGRVNVSIEDVPAVADNLSYSKTTDTSRPPVGQDAATGRGLGSPSLIGLNCAPAIPNGLVREHSLETSPPCIENALCKAGLGYLRRAHVADDNKPIFLCDLRGDLVLPVLSSVGDFGVDTANAFWRFSCPLQVCKLRLAGTEKPGRSYLGAIRQCNDALKAKVDADAGIGRTVGSFNLNRAVDIPTATGVLIETTSADFDAGLKQVAQVHRLIADATERERLAVEANVAGIERHPAERLAPTVPEPALFLLLAGYRVLLADALHRMGMQVEFVACTSRKSHQSNRRQPFISPRPPRVEGMLLGVVAIIPNGVNRPSLPIKLGCVLVQKTEFDGELHRCVPVKRSVCLKQGA